MVFAITLQSMRLRGSTSPSAFNCSATTRQAHLVERRHNATSPQSAKEEISVMKKPAHTPTQSTRVTRNRLQKARTPTPGLRRPRPGPSQLLVTRNRRPIGAKGQEKSPEAQDTRKDARRERQDGRRDPPSKT